MTVRRERRRPSGAGKRLCVALACAVLAQAGCGQKQDAGQWRPEDVTLLEPVGVTEVCEPVARRNLYDVNTYYGLVCPYVEEYQLDGAFTFDSYEALPGDPVKKGDVLLHADYEEIDEQIEAMEEEIAEMDEAYQEFLDEDRKSREKPLEDQQYGQAMENLENDRKAKEGDPDYAEWKAKEYDDPMWGHDALERRYRQATQTLIELDQALKERKELYELDRAYKLLCLERAREDKKLGALNSGMDGYVAGLNSASEFSGYYNSNMLFSGDQAPSGVPLVAVCDPSRLEIRSQYLTKNAYQSAEDVYAIVGGKRYEVEYSPIETAEEYERKKQESGGTVYGVFYPQGDTQDLTPGDYAVIVVAGKTRRDVLTVPNDSLVREGNSSYVYVLEGDSYVYTKVDVGISDGVYTEILSGLKEGDQVRTEQAVTAGEKTVKVARGRLCTNYETTGVLSYPDSYWVDNPVEYGTCYFVKNLVHSQQAVKKGDVLAEIRVVPDQAEMDRKEMQLARERERLQDLIDENDEEKNKDAIEARQETIRDLEEVLADMKADAATTQIVAPRDGIVRSIRYYEENSLIWPGDWLYYIADQKVMFLRVTNTDDQLAYGNTVTVKYKGADQAQHEAQGQVVTAGGRSLTGEMYNGEVLVKLPQEDFAAMADVSEERAGYIYVPDTSFKVSAEVRVMEDVLLVPREAVTAVGNNCYVKVKLETGGIRYQSFLSGGADGENYWALDGLTEGMELCLD